MITFFKKSLLSIIFVIMQMYAQNINEFKITSTDADSGDFFGCAVSLDRDYAIIGACRDDSAKGSAYIFKRSGINWVEQAKLKSNDREIEDWFGWAVSISEDYAVIGAKYDDDKEKEAGAIYIFKRDGENWIQEIKLTATDGDSLDFFGNSVSICGDYIIVGASYDDINANNTGSAYIFKRDSTNWVEQIKLTVNDLTENAWFGNSVSIFGDYALVGAPLSNGNESNSGSAYIFKKEGLNWNQGTKLTASDGVSGDLFGTSVSITNDYLIIGAPGDDNNGTSTGAAYIFKRNGEDWVEQIKLTADDGSAYAWFGNSVSIDSGFAVVGAYMDDENGMDCGSTYLYKRDQSSWIQHEKLTASDGGEQSWFGQSVSLSGDNIIVGAIFDKEKGYQAGAAYFYTGFITVGIIENFFDNISIFSLDQNYPNPFNPVTTISFYIPSSSFVSLIIIDQLGREVTTLISKNLSAGKHSRQWNASGMTSGVYFYRIQAGSFTETKKLILMK